MKRVLSVIVALVLALPAGAAEPLADFTRTWRDDAIWHDGQAEIAVYDATRLVYEKLRRYRATLYTNKEHVAAEPTFTKAEDPSAAAREVFKHHIRENIPTENYAYHFSTMAYIGADDLKSLKLDMGSIEDCGASFKQVINHRGKLRWRQFSYFSGEGAREGVIEDPPADLVFHDALSVVLRGFPFADPPADGVRLTLLPGATSNRLTSMEPVEVIVTHEGRQTLPLPIGRVEAHRLRVTPTAGGGSGVAGGVHEYWFAAQASPPWLHILVQYEGPAGTTLTLRSLERRAYWERP